MAFARTSVLSLSLVAVAAARPTVAQAQPGLTPPGLAPVPATAPASGPVDGEKSAALAIGLSLGVTVGGIALLSAIDDDPDADGLAFVGGMATWFGPTAGHWYAGRAWTGGLTARFLGLGVMTVGVFMVVGQDDDLDDDPYDNSEDSDTGGALLVVGALTVLGGALHDVVTAPGAVHRHNERLRAAAPRWSVAPTVGRDRGGLAVTGRF